MVTNYDGTRRLAYVTRTISAGPATVNVAGGQTALIYAHGCDVFLWPKDTPLIWRRHGTITSSIPVEDGIATDETWGPDGLVRFAHAWIDAFHRSV
jgi:hypothetical protein